MGWVVSVTPRPRFTPGERTPGAHWIGGWVGPRAGPDAGATRKILYPCRGWNLNRPFVQPVVRHYTAWATALLPPNSTISKPGLVRFLRYLKIIFINRNYCSASVLKGASSIAHDVKLRSRKNIGLVFEMSVFPLLTRFKLLRRVDNACCITHFCRAQATKRTVTMLMLCWEPVVPENEQLCSII
jgi:hypothetical protein